MNLGFFLSGKLRLQFDQAAARRAAPPRVDSDRQLDALRACWADAINDVPYYTTLVESGAAPRHIDSWSDVAQLPMLTRQVLRERAADFVRRSGSPDFVITTAGSTGTPLKVGLSREESDVMRVVKMAEWQAFGYNKSSRLFLIWGHSHLLGTGLKGEVNHLKRKLSDAALGYRRVDAYRLTRQSCAVYAEQLIGFRPIGVMGYASALDLFARYTADYRERFRALGLRFVLSTAEAPPRPDTVDLIEDHFGAPLVQEYGGAEFGQVAFKAGRSSFATYGDLNYVEATPGPEEEQALLITSLIKRYVPLVRYQTGDAVVAPVRAPHGHVDSFEAISGRVNDVIAFGAGDVVHSVAVFHCVHQERVHNIQLALWDDGIDLCLVSPETDRAAMEARIRARLAQVHPRLGLVRFKYLEDVELNRAGKRRWFIDHRRHDPCAASQAS
jgi:phenylacetate-CoA ligase